MLVLTVSDNQAGRSLVSGGGKQKKKKSCKRKSRLLQGQHIRFTVVLFDVVCHFSQSQRALVYHLSHKQRLVRSVSFPVHLSQPSLDLAVHLREKSVKTN